MPNIDRRDDEMPTQSLLMRYQSPYPRRSAYAKPDNFEPSALKRELVGSQDRLPEHLKEKIKAAGPIKRTGAGSKSIRDRIKEDGKKKQLEHDLNANPSNPDSYKNYKGPKPAPAGKKAPLNRFCGGKSKPYKRK